MEIEAQCFTDTVAGMLMHSLGASVHSATRISHYGRCGHARAAVRVLDETSDWLVACKPYGASVHEGADSLLQQLSADGHAPPLLPVHRIDATTTGVVLFAKGGATAALLQEALNAETTSKQYTAVLMGELHGAGCWSQPLTRRAEGRKNPQGSPRSARAPASTGYRVLETATDARLSLVELSLRVAGRTHQIRRHAALARHAVIGDRRYGEARHCSRIERMFGFDRVALHASRLSIRIDGVDYLYEAPLPAAWGTLLEPLGWQGRLHGSSGL